MKVIVSRHVLSSSIGLLMITWRWHKINRYTTSKLFINSSSAVCLRHHGYNSIYSWRFFIQLFSQVYMITLVCVFWMRRTWKLWTVFVGIVKHYKNSHRHYWKNCPPPCTHTRLSAAFKSKESSLCPLKRSPCHRWRTKMPIERLYRAGWIKLLNCFVHQGKHLRNRETVTCCSNLCPFKSHIYPSFMSQKSCFRSYCTLKDFKKKKLKNW